MSWLKRLLALALSLLMAAAFYVFAVMMEDEDSRDSGEFVVEAEFSPLTGMQPVESPDGRQLAAAFGLALPLPADLQSGRVEEGRWHGYLTRRVSLEGNVLTVRGIRPLSAAAALMPRGVHFTASQKALLGYPLMEAQVDGVTLYSLVTPDAAFLLIPRAGAETGALSLMEP